MEKLRPIWFIFLTLLPSLLCEPHYVTPQSSPSPSYVTIDNGILGDPEVRCGSEDISLHFASAKPFMGKIFVKGHVNEAECIQQGDSRSTQSFTIRFDSCGVRRQREINGVVIIATVIVSFHSIFITKVDRAYRTSCFYMEATKVVNQQIDVGALTTASIRNQVPIPTCRYEILAGGPSGNAVSFARIGDNVYHKWSCDAEVLDVYCMRVHSCTVYDGQGGSPVTVIDINGCSIDSAILRQLNYNSDLSAGQDALVFKFADRVGLYFNCQIQLTLKEKTLGCAPAQPECPAPSYAQAQVEPSTRTSEEVDEEPRERNEEKEEQRYPRPGPIVSTHAMSDERPYPTKPVFGNQPLVEDRPYPTKPVYISREDSNEQSIHHYATTPVTPSGYRYPSTTSNPEDRSGERFSGEGRSEEYVEVSSSRESGGGRKAAPYVVKVNPFEAATAASASSSSSSPSSLPIAAHPPGFRPKGTVKQLNISSGENSTEYPSSAEEPEDLIGSIEAAEATVAPRRVTSHPAPEPYTRLIRRARAKSAKTVESAPSPLFVADFDLPERSLIVLGIEDGHDTKSLADASAVFSESAPLLECSTRVLPLGYSLLLGSLLLLLSASIAVLAMIIYRQRKLLKNPIL